MTQTTNLIPLSSAEADEASRSLSYPHLGAAGVTRENRAARLEAYRQAESEITAQHRLWLEENYNEGFAQAVLDRIYQRAWDDGHSGGYHEVENYYDEHSTFAQFVITATQEDA